MAINSQDTSPLMLDQNGRTVPDGYRNVVSGNATVTTAGTKVQLSAVSTQAKKLDITANYTNSDMIVIGGTGVVGAAVGRKGVPIAPGNTYTFTVTDLSLVYIDSVANGDGVSYNYFY